MKRIIVLISLFTAVVTLSFAQNDFALTEQLFSRIAFNPAGTGNDENVNIFSMNRFQYAGAQGSPFSTLLNAQTYFDKASSGIGISISYDGSGMAYTQVQFKAVYAYHLNLPKNNLISFGIGLGGFNKTFDPNKHILEDDTERGDGFFDKYQSKTMFDASFGIEYSNRYVLVGASINHIPGYFMESSTMNIVPNYYAYVRGNIPCMEKLSLSPALSYYYTGQYHVIDANVTAFFCKYFWAGLGYHTEATAYVNIGVEWNWLRVGYSFDLNCGKLSNVAATSHELMLSFSIPTKKAASEWDE